MIEFVGVPVGVGGGPVCGRCSAPGAEVRFDPTDVVLDRIADAMRGGRSLQGLNVMLCGPEPLSHPELPRLVEGAVSAGVERLGLRTDAIGLTVGANAPGAVQAGVRMLEVTLFGGSPEAHDALAGRTGAFDATSRGVAAFLDAASDQGVEVAVMGRAPVCRHTIAHAPGTVAAFASFGAAAVRVELPATVSLADSAMVRAAAETGLVNGVWVWVEDGTGAEHATYGLHGTAVMSLRERP